MATFKKKLQKGAIERYPHPEHLGCELLMGEGYLFGGVPEEYQEKDEHVPIYNVQELVGYISYKRLPNGGVEVTITDVDNSQGEILTRAARNASRS